MRNSFGLISVSFLSNNSWSALANFSINLACWRSPAKHISTNNVTYIKSWPSQRMKGRSDLLNRPNRQTLSNFGSKSHKPTQMPNLQSHLLYFHDLQWSWQAAGPSYYRSPICSPITPAWSLLRALDTSKQAIGHGGLRRLVFSPSLQQEPTSLCINGPRSLRPWALQLSFVRNQIPGHLPPLCGEWGHL